MLWDIATGREIREFKGHPHGVTSVAISTDGKFALAGGETDLNRRELDGLQS